MRLLVIPAQAGIQFRAIAIRSGLVETPSEDGLATLLTMPAVPHKLTVVCALEFERDQLRRAGANDWADLHCCGPGREKIAAWVAAHAHHGRPIVLAGLAGGLSKHMQVGDAYIITEVLSVTGKPLTPTFNISEENLQGAGAGAVTVSCPEHSLTSPADKRAWRDEHGTDLIDLESEAFAQAASAAGVSWAIVRGVSDGVDDALPDSIDSWVDADGRVRRAVVAKAVLGNLAMVSAMRRLGARSKKAMSAVAEVLRHVTAAQ